MLSYYLFKYSVLPYSAFVYSEMSMECVLENFLILPSVSILFLIWIHLNFSLIIPQFIHSLLCETSFCHMLSFFGLLFLMSLQFQIFFWFLFVYPYSYFISNFIHSLIYVAMLGLSCIMQNLSLHWSVVACGLSSCSTWDLSSPNWHLTCVPLHCKVDSKPLGHQRSPSLYCCLLFPVREGVVSAALTSILFINMNVSGLIESSH